MKAQKYRGDPMYESIKMLVIRPLIFMICLMSFAVLLMAIAS